MNEAAARDLVRLGTGRSGRGALKARALQTGSGYDPPLGLDWQGKARREFDGRQAKAGAQCLFARRDDGLGAAPTAWRSRHYGEVLRLLGEAGLPVAARAGEGPGRSNPTRARIGCSRSMSRDLKLFVVDTGPLITLASAQSLDYLLYVNADIVIPDAVLYEATHDAARLGAQDIIEWAKLRRASIEIAPTKAIRGLRRGARDHPELSSTRSRRTRGSGSDRGARPARG